MSTAPLFHVPTNNEIKEAKIEKFRGYVCRTYGVALQDFWDLHSFSINNSSQFWEAIWDYYKIIGEKGAKLFDAEAPMTETRHRLDATLNYSENVLLSHENARSSTSIALIGTMEALNSKIPLTVQSFTFEELYTTVIRVAMKLQSTGLKPGDVVASYTSSNAEAVVTMLATSALGGIWTSISAEAGLGTILSRFEQAKPKILLAVDKYVYNGKLIDVRDKVVEVSRRLNPLGLEHVIVVGQTRLDRVPELSVCTSSDVQVKWHSWNKFITEIAANTEKFKFWRGSAMAPLWILFSSGTTGKPKAIVHHAGGMILAQKMTDSLHHDVGAGDCCLQFTTAGWMMWNVALSMIGVGATTIMYDGSPLVTPGLLFEIVDRHRVTYLGCSPRYLQVLNEKRYIPKDYHSLYSLRTMQVAGAPLSNELYDYIWNSINKNIYLNNASGGTASTPTVPLYYGEIPVPTLGMDIQAWNDEGKQSGDGHMVCLKPFPNQPLEFLDDPGDKKYLSTYYQDFKTPVWNHRDWINVDSATKGIKIMGRSDGVLNPQGVRFGSVELYDALESIDPSLEDFLAVGYRTLKQEEEVILFLKVKGNRTLDTELVGKVKNAIATKLSRRHVPAKIIQCPEIPYTTTLKRVEIYVQKIINGTSLDKIDRTALLNPVALDFFTKLSFTPTENHLSKRQNKL